MLGSDGIAAFERVVGYGVKTVPGVPEAIEQKQWNEAHQQIEVVAGVINNYAAEVDRAADIARGRAE